MVSHACTTIRTVGHYLHLMEGKKSEPSPRRSLLEWNKNRVLLILRSFHAWFVSEGGRRGRIKIVLLLRSSPSALIVSSYFSPRAADCKDTFTKGHPLLSHSDYFAWVSQWTVFVFLSPWHLSVRVSSTPTHTQPRVRCRHRHFRAFGESSDLPAWLCVISCVSLYLALSKF